MQTEWLGWLSSLILCATIARQIYTQYKAGTSKGVSKWLYIGQVGLALVLAQRRKDNRRSFPHSLPDLRESVTKRFNKSFAIIDFQTDFV